MHHVAPGAATSTPTGPPAATTQPRTSHRRPPPMPAGETPREAAAALLWAACRVEPDQEAVRRAAMLADPELAVDAAVAHGAAGLLRRALDRAGQPDRWGAARHRLHTVAQVQEMEEVLVLPRAAALALTPLRRAGLQPVVLKGAALVGRYPARGLRPMVDIDLLLPARQRRLALQALAAAGWRQLRQPDGGHYDTVLTHREVPSLAVELHHGLQGWHERANRLDPDELWQRRRAGRCLGQQAWVLGPEEELVLLAAHAGKPFHGFSRLVWLTDLAVVAADAGPTLDWGRVATLARRSRSATVVAAALSLATRLGLQVPPALVELPPRGWQAAALRPLLHPEWPLRFCGTDPAPVPFHLRFALADTAWRRVLLGAGGLYGRSHRDQLVWPALAVGRGARRWYRLRSSR